MPTPKATVEFVSSGLDELESGRTRPQLLHLATVWSGSDLAELEGYERWCDCLRTAVDLLLIAGSAPALMQRTLATRDSVDRYLRAQLESRLASTDANDLIAQIEASRHYDPSPKLESIHAPVVFVNSADDFINPPDLGIAEREIRRLPRGRFVLIPASDQTHGHGTHTWATFWKADLVRLLEESTR